MENLKYCGIILLGNSGSWAYGSTVQEAAQNAANLYPKGRDITVNVIETPKNDWFVSSVGIIDAASAEILPVTRVTI